MTLRYIVLIFVILIYTASALQAETLFEQQQSITGTVFDAETGETLPAANIIIKDTYRGTISNTEGRFGLSVSEFPVTLQVRFIGFQTMEIEFEEPAEDVEIMLQPVVSELEELVFTGEDPAIHIMERVIARKQIWRERLNSWEAEAYTRTRLSNEEGIVSITESFTTTWWDRDRGFREVVLDRRQTENILPDQNFSGVRYLPNFYDDDIMISGFRMIGVTHPDAFRYYDFKIAGQRQIDNDIVYDIDVIPKTRLQPVFKGRVSVLASEYALIEVNLVPGDMVRFPPPIRAFDLEYSQQFSNFGGEFWLPVDIRIDGLINIGIIGLSIPEIRFSQVSGITSYNVNIPVPDSLFRDTRQVTVDTLSTRKSRMFTSRQEAVPLSDEEREAYETIDSTKTVQDAFRPTGPLARFIDDDSGSARPQNFWDRIDYNPEVHFNRVDALYFGANPQIRVNRNLRIGFLAGYATGTENFAYGGNAFVSFGSARRTYASVNYTSKSQEQIQSRNYSRFFASSLPLVGYQDYYDHFQNDALRVAAGHRFRWLNVQPQVSFQHERHSSLAKTTNYSFGGGYIQRENPEIPEGLLNSVGFVLRAGDQAVPLGIVGTTGFTLRLEHSDPGLMTSDFDFTRLEATLDLRINTFLQRRFMPNTLDIRTTVFTSRGDLPPQRLGGFDGALGGFSPYGVFRTLRNRPLAGAHGAAVFWEHNFRSVPFELFGIDFLSRRSIGLLVHGASGRTWIDGNSFANNGFFPAYQDGWRHEAGISVNNIFGMFRFDTTFRIDQPGVYVGLSAARFF